MTEPDEESFGYESAMDMPSFIEMKTKVDGLSLFALMLSKEDRAFLKEGKTSMYGLARDVDQFYALLGSRHWIFHDKLPTSYIRDSVLSAQSVEDAERALCALYEDPHRMKFLVRGMMRYPEMRARQSLVEHARRDFEEKRYYAVVLNLLTVMDGFTNDVEKVHRGLHARSAEEVQSYDTAVGHHMGLTSTQASFRRAFSLRIDDEHFDLSRNGILHGNLTNYDNVIVASKAWNRLFAVVDWASSLEREAKPKEPEPTWSEVMQKVSALSEHKKSVAAWTASSGAVGSPDDHDVHSSTSAAATFLDLWSRSNWGHLANHFMQIGKGDYALATPKEVRSSFSPYKLDAYRIVSYEMQAPSIAEVQVELDVGGQTFPAVLRMAFAAEDGNTRVEGLQEGAWKMVFRSPEVFNRDLVKVAKY